MDSILDHVETNLGLIDRFLAQEQSVSLQRRSTDLTIYLALAALAVSLIALPSSLDAGVCGGIADRLGWNPTVVRILWIVLPPGWLLYVILWIVVPEAD